MARKLTPEEQADLERRIKAGPVCELIGGVPFVTPYEGFELPWYLEPIIEEAREIGEKLDRPMRYSRDLLASYRNQLHRYIAVIERRIGVTVEQVVAATRGMTFGPQDEAERAELREEIRWNRRLLAYRTPTATPLPTMTADQRKTLDRIERKRREADAATRTAATYEDQTKAYDAATKAGDEALALSAKIQERQDAEWAALALQEIDALAKVRGDDLDVSHAGTRRRQTPLERLAAQPKDRTKSPLISPEQYAAGVRYGQTWQRLYGGKNGEGTGSGELDPLESRISDLKRLDEARGYARENVVDVGGRKIVSTGLGGDARLIKLCDDICGAELSLREAIGQDTRKRRRAFPMFKQALGLLALHYGLVKTREHELEAA